MVTSPDLVDAMLGALVSRHRLCPHVAWAMLSRAAKRRGVSVADLCAASVDPAVVDVRAADGRALETVGS